MIINLEILFDMFFQGFFFNVTLSITFYYANYIKIAIVSLFPSYTTFSIPYNLFL